MVNPQWNSANLFESLLHWTPSLLASLAMLGTGVMPGRLDSSLRFIDIKLSVSRLAALGFIAVCFSCDELINSIVLSGLQLTLPSPGLPRAGRPITRGEVWTVHVA